MWNARRLPRTARTRPSLASRPARTRVSRRRLKGGSLSGTYHIREGGREFVRKDVSLVENREFGFQRWYSQLKRLQRFSVQFPDVFPNVLGFGRDRDTAYFDIEFVENAVTAHEFVTATADHAAIERMFRSLVKAMTRLHSVRFASSPEAIDLYIYEEVERKLALCEGNPAFDRFASFESIIFNGVELPPLSRRMAEYKRLAREHYQEKTECFTHGNLTLENVLYVPQDDRIVFVDPYEENVIDSTLNEYSQILQSSNAYYEVYNIGCPRVHSNRIDHTVARNPGLDHFNHLFLKWLAERLDASAAISVRLLEVSQFMRMLPFKMEIDESKMALFYALGSYLFDRLARDVVSASHHGGLDPVIALGVNAPAFHGVSA
ncbi:MAG: hypothetical protein B7733_11360 [Myxococcales bacterium FL481]|nr:MAG: hypothetical protein B7733_11360 [Myxococcales bacterium FL481]